MQDFLRNNEAKEVPKNKIFFFFFFFKFIPLFQTLLQSNAVKGNLSFFTIQTVTIVIHSLQNPLA